VSKIYTRRGDDGSTGLFGGPRVSKDDLRVAAYGEVDELNSALGVAREELRDPTQKEIADIVDRLQSELFNLGGQLATPDTAAAPKDVPRIEQEDVVRLEAEIDRFAAELPPMRYFLLPGGSRPGAALHFCRTVCRRAERRALLVEDANPEVVRYLNRLSDLLFILSRAANAGDEPLWQPGEH